MRGRSPGRDGRESYGWDEVRADLEDGVHPAVVASRLGEPEAAVRETAAQQGWSIVWDAQPDRATFAPDLQDFDA